MELSHLTLQSILLYKNKKKVQSLEKKNMRRIMMEKMKETAGAKFSLLLQSNILIFFYFKFTF